MFKTMDIFELYLLTTLDTSIIDILNLPNPNEKMLNFISLEQLNGR